MSKKQHASFWKYTGSHHNGNNCVRRDIYNFGVDLIAYAAYCADNKQFVFQELNNAEIAVKHGKTDGFGHEVEIAASKEIWDAVKLDYQQYQKLYA